MKEWHKAMICCNIWMGVVVAWEPHKSMGSGRNNIKNLTYLSMDSFTTMLECFAYHIISMLVLWESMYMNMPSCSSMATHLVSCYKFSRLRKFVVALKISSFMQNSNLHFSWPSRISLIYIRPGREKLWTYLFSSCMPESKISTKKSSSSSSSSSNIYIVH
jgi:hypothetical protein